MQIKQATDLRRDIEAGEELLGRAKLSTSQRRTLEQELRFMRAGLRGEEDAAYHIDVFFGRGRNFMTIHDLRFEIDGYSAQIDHLVLNRLSEVWVCESKHFVEGATINDQGEWSRSWGRKQQGMESPIAQNRRHMLLLKRAFDDGVVQKPRRLGVAPMTPMFRSLVLISKDATVKRPRRRMPELDQVIKVEEIDKHIHEAIDAAPMRRMASLISQDTLEKVARDLAAIHSAKAFDWEKRLGLSMEASAVPGSAAPSGSAASGSKASPISADRRCEECFGEITLNEIWYSTHLMKQRFGGRALCRSCQAKEPPA